MVGCAGESACLESAGETHLDMVMSDPGDYGVMLHHTSLSCSAVGLNGFHAYYVEGDEPMEMRSALEPSGGVAISSVEAYMPAHGHGSSDDPTINGEDASYFDVFFQMPGTWELTLELTVPALSEEPQTVVFELEVLD